MGRRLKPAVVTSDQDLQSGVLDRIRMGVVATDVDGRVTYWNAHAERLFGWPPDEARGCSVVELLAGPGAGAELAAIQASALAGEGWQGDLRARHRDGSALLVFAAVSPVTHPDRGVVGLIAIGIDVTERLRQERLLAARTGVTRALAESLSLEEAIPRILAAVCENLEWDVGAMWRVDEAAGVIGAVDTFRRPGVPGGAFEELSRTIRFQAGVGLPGRVWASAGPAWIPDVVLDDNFPRAAVAGPEGLHGAFGFPIALAGRVLGALEFFSREIRPPDPDLLQTMSVIGSQVGQFMERMEAERALRGARDELEASRDQLETILQGVDEGITVQDPSGRLVYANEASARLVGFESPQPFLGGSARVPIDRLDVRDEEGRPFPFERFPGQRVLAGEGPNEALIRFRRAGDGEERWCLVRGTPILDEGGSLRFSVAIFHDVTDARLAQEEQRSLARKLQQSLLPPDLPEIPGMEVSGTYRWGAKGAEVGGDFYDAFQTGDGNWALVIGDVCGKGPEAAVVTGLARHTIRAVALRERRPSRVLSALNTAMLQQRGDQTFCTLCYVRVKPSAAGARLTIGVAGHPLPVVVRADGSCEQAGTPGTLLGIFPDPSLHERSIDLLPGDAVVLFTDGVIEARRGDESLGVPRLLRLLSGTAGLSARRVAAVVDDAAASFSPEGPLDDVAVLVLRVVP
jgi:sigma-B regulation protein RsbU (phosphoserine phosphatase)